MVAAEPRTLGQCYKQLNSSVGQFGTSTLIASTRAMESTSSRDRDYRLTEGALALLDHARDAVAGQIKTALSGAEFDGARVNGALGLLVGCRAVIATARHLGG